MAKNSIRRTQAAVQRADEVGMLREEHIVIDNNPMPTAEELSKYKDISPDLVQYFMKITDEERSIRHEVTRQSIELTLKPWLAGIFSTLSVASIISAFIQGRKEE